MKNKKKPVAFITGVTGQDGAYLANLLLCKGYDVFGGFRRGATNKTWRLDFLGITKCIKLLEFQLNEPQHLIEILKKIQPNEIYHLAGESMVADSFKYPSVTLESNTIGTLNILEAVRIISPKSKIFFASSSEIFGKNSHNKLLNESSLTQPNNPYAISKLTANYFFEIKNKLSPKFFKNGKKDDNLFKIIDIIKIILFIVVNNLKSVICACVKKLPISILVSPILDLNINFNCFGE